MLHVMNTLKSRWFFYLHNLCPKAGEIFLLSSSNKRQKKEQKERTRIQWGSCVFWCCVCVHFGAIAGKKFRAWSHMYHPVSCEIAGVIQTSSFAANGHDNASTLWLFFFCSAKISATADIVESYFFSFVRCFCGGGVGVHFIRQSLIQKIPWVDSSFLFFGHLSGVDSVCCFFLYNKKKRLKSWTKTWRYRFIFKSFDGSRSLVHVS